MVLGVCVLKPRESLFDSRTGQHSLYVHTKHSRWLWALFVFIVNG
jgi:hypothetical protein